MMKVQVSTYYWDEIYLEDLKNWAKNPDVEVELDYPEIHVIRRVPYIRIPVE